MTRTRIGSTPPMVTRRPWTAAETDGALTAITAITGIGASILGTLLVFSAMGRWPALLGALLLACVPPGAAVMCWVDSDFGVLQAGLTLTLSLAVTTITSTVMVWLSAWHPKALLVVVLASVVSCAARLWRRGVPHLSSTTRAADLGQWWGRLAPLAIGLAAWAYGISQIHPGSVGPYGLLASANISFYLGGAAVLGGGLAELLRKKPSAWLVSAYLAALIVVIYATVPVLFKAPEYGWVYKHLDLILTFGQNGRVTNTSDIYQEWPAFFTAGAAVCRLANVVPLDLATWAPLAFELADALLLLGIFRMIAKTRRSAYLGLFLYEAFIAWVGQDYLSPQAFAFTLWLGIANIILRWLMIPAPSDHPSRLGVIARVRVWALGELPEWEPATSGQRRVAVALIAVLYSAIVASHQLTPYMALLGVGTLVIFGLLWRGWMLLAVLAVLAIGYLIPRYGIIATQFGGLFSNGSAITNASGVQSVSRQGAQVFTADFVHVLAIGMWVLAFGSVVRHWRRLGQVAVPALLGFSPFVLPFLQSYGGEVIYRVYMFSAPWCAILIADSLLALRAPAWRRTLAACACVSALGTGLQGSYGAASVDGFTAQELSASLWLYDHAPHGSLFVMAADDFPSIDVLNTLNKQAIPADPQIGNPWLDEANLDSVEKWMASLAPDNTAYVVFSRGMDAYVNYYGVPRGYFKLKEAVAHSVGWSVAYRNSYTTIYRVTMSEFGM